MCVWIGVNFRMCQNRANWAEIWQFVYHVRGMYQIGYLRANLGLYLRCASVGGGIGFNKLLTNLCRDSV